MIVKRQTAEGPRFVVYHNAGRKRRYVGSFGTRKKAEHAEQDFAVRRRKIDSGELPEGMEVERTFRDASADWMTSLRKRKSRSADGYEKRLDLYLRPAFGDMLLGEVTKPRLMDFRDRMALKYAPSTVN